MARISTPCIKVCFVDRESGLCEGCGRTVDEIATWGAMSEADRLTVMAGLEDRMRRVLLEGEPMPLAVRAART